jgi:hemerythrin-like domain-containing protein
MEKALRIIYDEHRSISAVLNGLLALAREASKPEVRPEFPVLNAMIHYIDQFPERLHHPKEEQYLFARLAERAPESRALIEELRAEHLRGAQLIRELESALRVFEVNDWSSAAAFAAAAEAYAQFHWDHMRKEEKQLIPLLERAFTPEDWAQVNEAFAGNQDPIADLREADFKDLFSRIVGLAPDPVGLASRWKSAL